MSELTHLKRSHEKSEHGTTQSYVIGFVLSLFCTINAYYLVVSKSVTGTALLATILVFAVLQMAIQIFFFLHLGRGPKPLYNVVFFVGTVGLILVTVLGSIFIMNNLHYNMAPTDVTKKLAQDEGIAQVGGLKTGACQEVHLNHQVTINAGKVSPTATSARLCDTLTLVNQDDATRAIVFGVYPQQQSYGGQSELSVHKNYPKTITLNQSGTYVFYDSLYPNVTGSFTVSQ
jgi:cytochrome o ubiquinol oxidase subunit IV